MLNKQVEQKQASLGEKNAELESYKAKLDESKAALSDVWFIFFNLYL